MRLRCRKVKKKVSPSLALPLDYPTFVYFGVGTIGNLEHRLDKDFPGELLANTLRILATYAPCGWLLLSFDTTHDREMRIPRDGDQHSELMSITIPK